MLEFLEEESRDLKQMEKRNGNKKKTFPSRTGREGNKCRPKRLFWAFGKVFFFYSVFSPPKEST